MLEAFRIGFEEGKEFAFKDPELNLDASMLNSAKVASKEFITAKTKYPLPAGLGFFCASVWFKIFQPENT